MSWIDSIVHERSTAAQACTAWIGECEFMMAQESDSTGRTVKLRILRPPEDQGKANPFAKFTRKRRGKAGSRFEVSFAPIGGDSNFMLELMLLNWQSNPQGDSVVFLLSHEAAQHPFMGCTRGSKDAAGTRWMIVAIELDDSEQAIQEEKQERLEHSRRSGRDQYLSNVARLLTKNETFWAFLSEFHVGDCGSVAAADEHLKSILGIESKSELDSEGPEGVEKIAAFHRLRKAFLDYQDRNGHVD